MRNPFRIVFLLLALAANAALAQQSVVYTVDGWASKAPANSFVWGVTAPNTPATTGASGKLSFPDSTLTIPLGDPAVQFVQAAMRGTHLGTVLIEFPLKGARPSDPAPFAIRLTEVFVTSVTLGKSGGDGGPGTAEIKLKASRIEMYSSRQDPTGKMSPAAKAGIDARAMKAY